MTLINRVHTNSSKHHMQINETISSSFLVNSPYMFHQFDNKSMDYIWPSESIYASHSLRANLWTMMI